MTVRMIRWSLSLPGNVQQRNRDSVEFMELNEKKDREIRELSGGMKRRLMIARALLNAPEILILDEPTTGLDPQARHPVWERLRCLKRRGVTLLLTTHYMEGSGAALRPAGDHGPGTDPCRRCTA